VLREWEIRYALVNLSEYGEQTSILLDELAAQKRLRLITTVEDILVYEVLPHLSKVGFTESSE
jgi:hypothetical protein